MSTELGERERHTDGTPLRIPRVATGTYVVVSILFRSRFTLPSSTLAGVGAGIGGKGMALSAVTLKARSRAGWDLRAS